MAQAAQDEAQVSDDAQCPNVYMSSPSESATKYCGV